MALATYSDLLAALPNHIARDGDTALATVLPDLITMFEAKANALIRCLDMEANATGTADNGVLSLPSGFLGWRRVTHATAGPLTYIEPEQAAAMFPTNPSGNPAYFTVLGTTLVTYPAVSDELSLDYYQAIPALSTASPTNWLLTKRPDIYVTGCKVEMLVYGKNFEEAKAHSDMLLSLVQSLNAQSDAARYPQEPKV